MWSFRKPNREWIRRSSSRLSLPSRARVFDRDETVLRRLDHLAKLRPDRGSLRGGRQQQSCFSSSPSWRSQLSGIDSI